MTTMTVTDFVDRALLNSSRYQSDNKAIKTALKNFSEWHTSNDYFDYFKLKDALTVIAGTDTIAKQVAPELVDLMSNYSRKDYIEKARSSGDLHNASSQKWEESNIKTLAIQAAVFAPATEGLKEALLNLFKDKSEESSGLRLEVVKAFNKVNVDEAVINMLVTALSDKENSVRLEAAKLLKTQKVNSNEIIDTFVKELKTEPLEDIKIVIVEILAQIGANAVKSVPTLSNELADTERVFASDVHAGYQPFKYNRTLKLAIRDICNAASLKT